MVYSRLAEAPVEAVSLVEFLYVDAGDPDPFRRARPATFKQGRADLDKSVRDAAETALSVFE